jgi:hypothetical protein
MKNKLVLAISLWLSIAYLQAQKDVLYPFPNTQGKWGYVDGQKNVKIAHQFLGASPFYEERAIVARTNETAQTIYSVIDTQGKIVFDFNLTYNEPLTLCQMDYFRYSDGLLLHTEYNDKNVHKYYDKAGKVALELTEAQALIALRFSEGLAYTQVKDSAWAYIDKTGKRILEGVGVYGTMEHGFSSGWSIGVQYKEDGRVTMHYFNTKGEKNPVLQKYEGKVEELGNIHEGHAFIAVKNPDSTAFLPQFLILHPDGSFKNVAVNLQPSSPMTYVTGYYFENGLAYIRYLPAKSDREVWTYLNTEGKIAFDLPTILRSSLQASDYHAAMGAPFHQGLACWRVEGEYTYRIVYLNTAGKVALDSGIIKK